MLRYCSKGEKIMSIGPGTYFPGDDLRRRCRLLIRDFYPRLLQRMSDEPLGASLLTGVPGIGKTWFVWYAVHSLLKLDSTITIVWQSAKRNISECVMFKDGKSFIGSLTAFKKELEKTSTW